MLNIVTASRQRAAEVVDVWLDDPRVRKLSFTGSTPVGKHLARRSADTLKKLSPGARRQCALHRVRRCRPGRRGRGAHGRQVPQRRPDLRVSPNRVLVQAGVHDRFVDRLGRAHGRAEGRARPATRPRPSGR